MNNKTYNPLETWVVDTGGAASSVIINKRPSTVHWITVSAETLNTQGLIQIYDGFDTGGKLVWQLEPGYSRHHNFIPSFCCHQGIFVYCAPTIASYTIGYCVEKRGVKTET